ncbi:hypothetical protein BDQ17DRAFT_1435836 [Cyathus striatus]|nr:hypothetical protein BDQ17DRAFT_1435836 [Cyathus striatus]
MPRLMIGGAPADLSLARPMPLMFAPDRSSPLHPFPPRYDDFNPSRDDYLYDTPKRDRRRSPRCCCGHPRLISSDHRNSTYSDDDCDDDEYEVGIPKMPPTVNVTQDMWDKGHWESVRVPLGNFYGQYHPLSFMVSLYWSGQAQMYHHTTQSFTMVQQTEQYAGKAGKCVQMWQWSCTTSSSVTVGPGIAFPDFF